MKVCPSCGESGKQFVGAFCIDCFSKKPLVEIAKGLELQFCPKCERAKSGNDWVALNKSVVLDLVERKSKSRFPLKLALQFTREKNQLLVQAHYSFDVDGTPVKQEKRFEIALLKNQCPDCSRQSGGYKEAIVQIRGNGLKVEQKLAVLEKLLEGKTFWKVEVQKKGGVNVTAGSKSAVFAALSQMRTPFKLSHKLVGVKNGKRVFLVTALIRL